MHTRVRAGNVRVEFAESAARHPSGLLPVPETPRVRRRPLFPPSRRGTRASARLFYVYVVVDVVSKAAHRSTPRATTQRGNRSDDHSRGKDEGAEREGEREAAHAERSVVLPCCRARPQRVEVKPIKQYDVGCRCDESIAEVTVIVHKRDSTIASRHKYQITVRATSKKKKKISSSHNECLNFHQPISKGWQSYDCNL